MHLFLFAIVSSLFLSHDVKGFSPASGAGRLISSPSRAALHPSSPASHANDVILLARHRSYSTGVVDASSCANAMIVKREMSSRLYSSTGDDGGDNQAEIAALEERLRQLKQNEEGASSTAAADETDEPASAAADAVVDEDEAMLEGESDDSVMFSERWKEAKDGYETNQQENALGGIAKVGAGLAFVILLGLFSQVPVGEESLQRYQDVKGSSSRIDLGDLNPEQ